MKFSLNTNSLGKHLIPEIITIAEKAGVDGLEWGLGSLETAAADAKAMQQASADAGLEILSFINAGSLWKTDEIRRWSEAVAGAGGHILRVAHPWFAWDYNESVHQPDTFQTLVERSREGFVKLMELGKEYDIRYVLETHSASCFASPLMVPLALKDFDSRYCGVIYDPANTIREGFVRPSIAVEVMNEFIAYLHVKNVMWKETRNADGKVVMKAERRMLDNGIVDYTEIMFALKLYSWDGWFSFEEFVNSEPSLISEEVRTGIAYLKKCYQEAKSSREEPYLPFNYR